MVSRHKTQQQLWNLHITATTPVASYMHSIKTHNKQNMKPKNFGKLVTAGCVHLYTGIVV